MNHLVIFYLFYSYSCVQMFWAAVMELTPTQVRALLKATLPTSAPEATVDEILYGSLLGTSEETAATAIRTGAHVGHKIHIMPPTAVALLSADTSDIVFFPTLGAISLPRFSNLRTMYDQLVRVLKLP